MAKKTQGSVLIIVLWILVILGCLSVGISRELKAQIRMCKTQIAKAKARYAALSGFEYAMAQMKKDLNDPIKSKFDNLFECGVALGQQEGVDNIWGRHELVQGFFSIFVNDKNTAKPNYSLIDEERKINLNAIGSENANILIELLILLEVDDESAQKLTEAIINWHSPKIAMGADGPRASCPDWGCKERPFDHIEELLLLPGMTEEIYVKLREYVTVYPKFASRLNINVATASLIVLKALARSYSNERTNTIKLDADQLAEKIIKYRNGPDGIAGSRDDHLPGQSEDLALTGNERAIYLTMGQNMTSVSHIFSVNVNAIEKAMNVSVSIQAIVNRDEGSILAWSMH